MGKIILRFPKMKVQSACNFVSFLEKNISGDLYLKKVLMGCKLFALKKSLKTLERLKGTPFKWMS